MALLRFTVDGQQIGIVRNQKCGSTTVLNYVGQCMWNHSPHEWCNYTLAQHHFGHDSIVGWHGGFEDYESELRQCDMRIALYREPVEKLVSGYGYTKKRGFHDKTFDGFLSGYSALMQVDFIRLHCRTNTALVGSDRGLYTHCFRVNEVNTKLRQLLFDLTGKEPERVHHRQGPPPVRLSVEQRDRARAIMAVDYEYGWC